MKGPWIFLILALFIYVDIALSENGESSDATLNGSEDPVYLTDLGIYQTTFGTILYDKDANLKMGNIKYNKGVKLKNNNGGYIPDMGYEDQANFNLNGEYSHLTGLIGLDDENYWGYNKKLTVLIQGDGTDLYTIEINKGDLPAYIDLDVSGVRRFTIITIFEQTYSGTMVDLVDMLLTK